MRRRGRLNAVPGPLAGFSFRPRYRSDVMAEPPPAVEVIIDHYLDGTWEQTAELDLLAERTVVLPHGLDLNLGCAEGPDRRWLERAAPVIARIAPPWWSEHLAFTGSGGRRLGHLAPLPRTRAVVALVAANLRRVAAVIPTPLILENIACPVDPGGELDEPEFLRAVSDETGCGLLLDVANAWCGCANRGEPFAAWLDRFPCDRVVQFHVAGNHRRGDLIIDSHAAPVSDPVWDALRLAAERCPVRAAILERDDRLPPWNDIQSEVARIQTILAAAVPHGSISRDPAPASPIVRATANELADGQSTFVRAATGDGPPVAALGLPAEDVALYADLLRAKRLGELRQALPRSAEMPGFAAHADAWWRQHHHRDRDFRGAVLAFIDWLRPRLDRAGRDLLDLEALGWRGTRPGPWLGWARSGRHLHVAWRTSARGPLQQRRWGS